MAFNDVNTGTTANSAAWTPNVTVLPTAEALPELLINKVTTVINKDMLSDAAAVVLPVLAPSTADVVAEGAAITPTEHEFSEVTVFTQAVANLSILSIEMHEQMDKNALANNMQAALIRKSNDLLLNAPTTGLVAKAQAGGAVTASLDEVSDAVFDTGADFILLSRDAAKALATMKEATGSARPLVDNLNDLFGLEVTITPALTGTNILVGNRSATVSALSPLEVAKSYDYAFNRRAVATRAAFRQGYTVADATGLSLVTVTAE